MVDIVYCENGKVAVVTEIAKCYSSSRLDLRRLYGLLGHVKCDWYAKEVPIGKANIFDDTGTSGLAWLPLRDLGFFSLPRVIFLVQETCNDVDQPDGSMRFSASKIARLDSTVRQRVAQMIPRFGTLYTW